MKITVDLLKKESCNFDLECIFELNLSRKGITDLDCLSLCSNVEFLNLTSNELKDLIPLKYLIKLQYLNLSCNQIKSLDGLELLENLKTLNLAGNSIFRIEEFFKLKNLKYLTQLKLTDNKNEYLSGSRSTVYSNPICSNRNYAKEIFTILPNLESVDDYSKSNNNILQNMMELLIKNENDVTSKPSEYLTQSDPEPWLNESLLAINFTERNGKNQELLDEQRAKFYSLFNDLSATFNKNNDLLDS